MCRKNYRKIAEKVKFLCVSFYALITTGYSKCVIFINFEFIQVIKISRDLPVWKYLKIKWLFGSREGKGKQADMKILQSIKLSLMNLYTKWLFMQVYLLIQIAANYA